MSVRDRVRSWLGVEERTVTPQSIFSYGQWTDLLGSAAGQPVTVETAMRAAAGACVRLLADDISSLPADAFVREGRATIPAPSPPWMASPSGRITDTFISYVSDWITSIGTDGNAFTLCLPDVLHCEYIEVLNPSTVWIAEDWKADPFEKGTVLYKLPGGKEATDMQVLHVPWVRLPGQRRGLSPVRDSKESIGLELAARKWAGAFFRNGGTLGGIVEVPGGPDTVDADKLREQFEARHSGEGNWWKPGVLTGGAKYQDTALKPAEADLAPLWRHVLEEACRVYHIPPHLLASQDPGGAARASVEERGIDYARHAIRPFVSRFERAHSALLPVGFVKLNINALMRGDSKTRAEYYDRLTQAKIMRREEARDLEDLPWDGELGYLETPNNNRPPDSPTEDDESAEQEAA